MTRSEKLQSLGSELFTNLSAGWFGAAFIIPSLTDSWSTVDLSMLTLNSFLGIVCLSIAYNLKN